MIYVGAPEIKCVWNVLRAQDVGKVAAAFRGFVISLPRKNVNGVGLTQDRQVVVVIEIRKIVSRVIEIDVVVVKIF